MGTCSSPGLHVAQVGGVQPSRGRPVKIIEVSSPSVNENEWQVVHLDPHARQVQIAWSDGPSAECGQSDQALVNETDHAITIGLHSTYSGPDVNCAAYAVSRTRTIPLAAPIGTRSLLEYVPAGVDADYSPRSRPRCSARSPTLPPRQR